MRRLLLVLGNANASGPVLSLGHVDRTPAFKLCPGTGKQGSSIGAPRAGIDCNLSNDGLCKWWAVLGSNQ